MPINDIQYSFARLTAGVMVTILSTTFSASISAAQQPGQVYSGGGHSNRIIVKYSSSSPLNTSVISPAMTSNAASARTGHGFRHIRRMYSGAHVMALAQRPSSNELNQILSDLNADPDVEYAEADLLLKPMTIPNDTRYNEQWHYYEATAGINLPTAWDVTQGNTTVVAVIDTGYLPHADLAGNLLAGYDMISDPDIAQDGDGRDSNATDPGDWSPANACEPNTPAYDSSWHGTHVAGTIAAVGNNGLGVAGVAYQAKVVPVRVLGRCGGYTSDIADGIIWAAGGSVNGISTNNNPVNVINLSLGGYGSCGVTQQNAINTARSLGVTVVVAAGNENMDAANSTPANCSGVVTVAAVNRNGGRAYYSNYGTVVDVAAPGGDTRSSIGNGILSTLNAGSTSASSDSYAFYQGTSMATPHVAGVAALMYAVNPSLTPDAVEAALKSSARSFPATCSQCGSGIIDAAAAVAAVNNTTPPADDVLENGVTVSGLAGASGSELRFTLDVPIGASDLVFQLSGGSGDADLYVRYGAEPTTSVYDCRPYLNGNEETCTITNVQAGTYHVMLRGYTSFSNTSIVGSFTEGGTAGSISETNLSASTGGWQHFTLDVPVSMSTLNVDMSNGTGDADLYVRFGATPTLSTYSCRPYLYGNNENCSLSNPQAGTWYISIRAYSTYAGVSLDAEYQP